MNLKLFFFIQYTK